MSKSLDKPEPPAPNECCENGCEACVWDIYREALDEWKDQQKVLKQNDGLKPSTD